jgi:transcriptional regulator with XRE-family HTH domain
MRREDRQSDRLSDQLRWAIQTAEISQYELARRIGLDKSVLSRFMHDKSGLSVPNIDRIGKELGLELRKTRKTRTKKG